MTGDAATELLRERLAKALPGFGTVLLDAVTPVVEAECRRRAAEELRAAAEEIGGQAQANEGHAVHGLQCNADIRAGEARGGWDAVRRLEARADAIEGRP